MSNFTAVLDACVLYPSALRNLLLNLATTDCFRARWTDEITQEWTRNLLVNHPDITKEMLERTVNNMTVAAPDCLIINYKFMINSISHTHEKDRHVLAAAIVGYADVIVTENLKDFDAEKIMVAHDIEIQHPDIFIGHLLDLSLAKACGAIRKWRVSCNKPPYTPEDLLELILKMGLPVTYAKLKENIDLI